MNDPADRPATRPLFPMEARAIESNLAAAVTFHGQGQLLEAETLYQQILSLVPEHISALHHLGVLFCQSNRHAAAAEMFRRILARDAGHLQAAFNLGVACRSLGRHEESITAFARVVGLKSDSGLGHMNLGVALLDAGQPRRALRSLRRAVALMPEDGVAHYTLANCLNSLDAVDEAEAAYRRALSLVSTLVEAWMNLGNLLLRQRRLGEAADCFRQAATLEPTLAGAHVNLGNVLRAEGRLEEAKAAYLHALALAPEMAEALYNLAFIMRDLGAVSEGVEYYSRARLLTDLSARARDSENPHTLTASNSRNRPPEVAAAGDFAEAGRVGLRDLGATVVQDVLKSEAEGAHTFTKEDEVFVKAAFDHADILESLGRTEETEACFLKALEVRPNSAALHNFLAQFYARHGRLTEAKAAHHRAADLNPASSIFRDNGVFLNLLDSDLTNERLFALTQVAERRTNRIARFAGHANHRDPERPLRIGYVSSSLMLDMNVYYFMGPLLRHADPAMVENYIYGDSVRGPNPLLPQRYPGVRAWRNTRSLSAIEAGSLIREDGIDILVNVLGRAYNNDRVISFFHRKPAPVQVSFHASMTSGLEAIDYFIADVRSVPRSGSEGFSERVVRLPRLFNLVPDLSAPEVAPTPALARGVVTFGFYGSIWKLNDAVASVWARVLAAVPGSRLLLKGPGLGSEDGQALQRQRFARFGVDQRQLLFMPSKYSIYGHLTAYGEIDISLDAFPYCGGNSTLESLWMGVPVLTLAGERFIGRMSTSILGTVGLSDFIATSPDDYVAKAVAAVRDIPRLAATRAGLRQHLCRSPLVNGERYARILERTYRQMWRRWCAGEAVPSP